MIARAGTIPGAQENGLQSGLRSRTRFRAFAYGALVTAASWLHYAVLSRFSGSDEGGLAWFRQRLRPVLPARTGSGPRIWIHAVSAGEAKVAESLRRALLVLDPALSVVLSSTTYAGHARIQALAGAGASFIMPLDTPGAQRRLFATVRPDLLVLVESEFWPAQFAAAAEAGVPVMVVNATLSARSFAGHRRHPALTAATILRAERIYAQDETIAARYRAIGVAPEQLELCGNLKLVPPPGPLPAREHGAVPTVTFGNIHREELEGLAPAILDMRRRHPEWRLVLVPRYPGKTAPELLRQHLGAGLAIVSDETEIEAAGKLVWLNQMGTLSRVYARSAIGIVCGTFCAVGGHDLAEPLHLGAASLYGPRVERQRGLHQTLAALGCATQVDSPASLPEAVEVLLGDAPARLRDIEKFAALSQQASARLAEIAREISAAAARPGRAQ